LRFYGESNIILITTTIMILSTTPTLQTKEITEYLGIVTAEAIMGAHIGRDFLAGLRDFFWRTLYRI